MSRRKEWDFEKIKIGLDRFYLKNHRPPKTREFDSTEYLPNSRTIMREFGGLKNLRTTLGYDTTDYRSGTQRSAVATRTYRNAMRDESRLYKKIIAFIPEIYVHEHKILRPGNVCCDFFIYRNNDSSREGIVVDIFYAENLNNLGGVVNIKAKRYHDILKGRSTYFVCSNSSIEQSCIDELMKNKKNKLHDNLHVVSENHFIETILPTLKPSDI